MGLPYTVILYRKSPLRVTEVMHYQGEDRNVLSCIVVRLTTAENTSDADEQAKRAAYEHDLKTWNENPGNLFKRKPQLDDYARSNVYYGHPPFTVLHDKEEN